MPNTESKYTFSDWLHVTCRNYPEDSYQGSYITPSQRQRIKDVMDYFNENPDILRMLEEEYDKIHPPDKILNITQTY